MAAYEYEVLKLEQALLKTDEGERKHFCWHSSRHGRVGVLEDLAHELNSRGADGWHIVTYASDGHFGNTIVLERPIAAAEPKEVAVAAKEPTPSATAVYVPAEAPPVVLNVAALDAITAELGQFRQELRQWSGQQARVLAEMGTALPQALQATLNPAFSHLSEQLRQPVPIAVTSELAPGILERLEGSLLGAIDALRLAVQPPSPVLVAESVASPVELPVIEARPRHWSQGFRRALGWAQTN